MFKIIVHAQSRQLQLPMTGKKKPSRQLFIKAVDTLDLGKKLMKSRETTSCVTVFDPSFHANEDWGFCFSDSFTASGRSKAV